jgi:glycosyltransferase involved in cell wall biosynthesis
VKTVAVIPAWNEEGAIGPTVARLPRHLIDTVLVIDAASTDATVAEARTAGAVPVVERRRGYGRACQTGVEHAKALGADTVLFLDGDGSDAGEEAHRLLDPIAGHRADFTLALRSRAGRAPGSMGAHQVLAGHLVGAAIGVLAGHRYADMCAFRAIRLDLIERLPMREMGYGWNLEMQMRAAFTGARIVEIPMPYRTRIAGRSKVAGTLRGTIKAGGTILRTIATTRRTDRPIYP